MNISKQGHYLAGNGTMVASLGLGPPFLFVHAGACLLLIGSRTFGALAFRLIQNKTTAFGWERGARTQWALNCSHFCGNVCQVFNSCGRLNTIS